MLPGYAKVLWFALPAAVGLIIFGNHYARDAVGALELQLEAAIVTPSQFFHLNALFFGPNIITPFLAGGLQKRCGGAAICLLISVFIGGIGHLLFAYGIKISSLSVMITGRLVAGCMYEVIDSLPIIIIGPLYEKNIGLVLGTTNSFLRLGSVFNFIMCPYLYNNYSLLAAFWFAGAMAFVPVIFAIFVIYAEKYLCAEVSLLHEGELESSTNGDEYKSSDWDISKIESKTSPKQMPQLIERSGETRQSSRNVLVSWIKEMFPLDQLSSQFYSYCLAGSFLYGAMVPFWFIGSKYLQEYYGMTVGVADSLMLLPEGAIVLVAIPLGIALDRYNWTMKQKLLLLAASIASLAVSYLLLIAGAHSSTSKHAQSLPDANRGASPLSVAVLTLLGFSYAFSNSVFWSISTVVVGPSHLLGAASGLLGSVMNVLPSVIPPLVAGTVGAEDNEGCLYILAVTGALGALSALLAAFQPGYEADVNDRSSVKADGDADSATVACRSSSQVESGSDQESCQSSGSIGKGRAPTRSIRLGAKRMTGKGYEMVNLTDDLGD